jgi:hypothetical protein
MAVIEPAMIRLKEASASLKFKTGELSEIFAMYDATYILEMNIYLPSIIAMIKKITESNNVRLHAL